MEVLVILLLGKELLVSIGYMCGPKNQSLLHKSNDSLPARKQGTESWSSNLQLVTLMTELSKLLVINGGIKKPVNN
jgi:hypothetical protein